MSATDQRDQANNLAKSNPKKALSLARKIDDPWFRAQALSWVARFTDGDSVAVAHEAARAAEKCEDIYKQAAVRSWEIAALAERGLVTEARTSLAKAVDLARIAEPVASRSEALFLLLQAASKLGMNDAQHVFGTLQTSCTTESHWRCKRNLRDAQNIITGKLPSRPFFW